MTRLEQLEQSVRGLYEQKHENRADWADWLYTDHVPHVVRYAKELAAKYGVGDELPCAAAWLHDCADAVMLRFDPGHAARTREISVALLQEADFTEKEIAVIVDDAIERHSCRDGKLPQTIEGKILAVADAFAHYKTDYYLHFLHAQLANTPMDETKHIVLKKLERDYHEKIPCLPDERAEIEADYHQLKGLFSR